MCCHHHHKSSKDRGENVSKVHGPNSIQFNSTRVKSHNCPIQLVGNCRRYAATFSLSLSPMSYVLIVPWQCEQCFSEGVGKGGEKCSQVFSAASAAVSHHRCSIELCTAEIRHSAGKALQRRTASEHTLPITKQVERKGRKRKVKNDGK